MAQRSFAVRLLTLPFRPVLRWFTLGLVLILAGATYTGHLGLGARYLWWRLWPFGTPLIEYAPEDARVLVLLDLCRPQASRLAPVFSGGALQKRVDAVAAALDVNPRRDVLQVMWLQARGSTVPLVVTRGRFIPARVRAALEPRGYTPQGDAEGPLILVHGASREAVAVVGRSVLLQGTETDVRRALERARDGSGNLEASEVWERWLDRVGRRHAALAMRVNPAGQASLGEIATGDADRLEAAALTLDAEGEQDLRVELVLGPSSPAGLDALELRSRSLGKNLQGGAGAALPEHLRALATSMQLTRDEHLLRARSVARPADLARLARDLEQPNALAMTAVALASALALGGVLQMFGLDAGAPGSAAAPVLPDLGGAMRGWLDKLRGALPLPPSGPRPASGAAGHGTSP
ncbi:MAG: hypothetical protein ABIJ09_11010 [Pseudomonadota bacterium]